jgi:alkaline phosphatase D
MNNILRQLFLSTLIILVCVTGNAFGQATITHGPVLGRLSHDGIGIWVRTNKPGEFQVQVTPAGGGATVNARGTTQLEHDISGWVHVTGLQQNTVYDYTVTIPGNNAVDTGGQFTTLPHSDSYRNAAHNPDGLYNFSFEFACGNQQGRDIAQQDMAPFKTMLDQLHGKINFQIMDGDFIYEAGRNFTSSEWQNVNRISDANLPRNLTIAPPLAGVWQNYKTFYNRSPNLRAFHRNIPAFWVFDDHEIFNDVYGTGSPGHRNRKTVYRDIGVQGWHDYVGWSNPLPAGQQRIHFGRANLIAGSGVLEDSNADFTALDLEQAGTLHVHWGTEEAQPRSWNDPEDNGHPAAGVYAIEEVLGPHRLRISPAPKADARDAGYSIGMNNHYRMRLANCEFFVVDTKSHRQMHDVDEPWKKGISMLGERQKKWLKESMQSSDADFFFVVSSVNFMVPHVGSNSRVREGKDDAWTVFMEEREELINFWDGLGAPVFVLTGDIHNSFAIKITDRVWEFASGPHNSNNHTFTDEGDRPANGPFEYNGRTCDIRWSTFLLDDTAHRRFPHYCVVQINNVFNNPVGEGQDRWVAFPKPQVMFQYYDGLTGELKYAESILATKD